MFLIFGKTKLLLILLIVVFLLTVFNSKTHAQTTAPDNNFSITTEGAASLGVAQVVELAQKNVKDGSIVSSSRQGVVLSNIPYDPQV